MVALKQQTSSHCFNNFYFLRFSAATLIEKADDHLRLACIEWHKEPLESWRARAEKTDPQRGLTLER